MAQSCTEILLPRMTVTGVEVSVLRTPSIMAALTTWLSRWLKLNIMAQTELEVWLFEIFHEISYIIYVSLI